LSCFVLKLRLDKKTVIVCKSLFGEALQHSEDHPDSKNFYAYNPAFDKTAISKKTELREIPRLCLLIWELVPTMSILQNDRENKKFKEKKRF